MYVNTLIVIAPLSDYPSETLMFRYLTLVSKENLELNVLLEVEQYFKDKYYKLLLNKGALDYIEEFVTPEEKVEAIRLDKEINFPYTIIAKGINWQNVRNLTGQIRFLKNI